MSIEKHTDSEVELRRLKQIGAEIPQDVEEVERVALVAIDGGIKLGLKLIEAKSLVRHGEWQDWLAAHFPRGERSAQKYMKLARNIRSSAVLNARSMDEALNVLANPKPKQLPAGDLRAEVERAQAALHEAVRASVDPLMEYLKERWEASKGEEYVELIPSFRELYAVAQPGLDIDHAISRAGRR
jgi:hypothetical protein